MFVLTRREFAALEFEAPELESGLLYYKNKPIEVLDIKDDKIYFKFMQK